MLKPMQRRSVRVVFDAGRAHQRDGQRQHDAGDCRMDAGAQHEIPEQSAENAR
jgi:hypothetical protein